MRAIPNRVGVSGGPGKALANIGAVRAGLLNVLITDQDTAAEMLAILNAEDDLADRKPASQEFQTSGAGPDPRPRATHRAPDTWNLS